MKLFATILILGIIPFTFAQQRTRTKTERFPSYFGIAISPVIPNDFIGARNTLVKDSAGIMTTDFKNKWGLTFGGTIRIGLSKRIALETGISQVRRIYETGVSIPDSNINDSQKLAFVNYDIPINGLFYVQLSESWYMDASLGVSITHYPSDVRDSMLPKNGERIDVELRRTERTYFALNAGLGFEFRTRKAGNFFLGFGAKVPLKQPYFGVTIYQKAGYGKQITSFAPLSAGYFTIDFRYFIPSLNQGKKARENNKSLIE